MKRTEWRDFTPPNRDNPGRSPGGICRRHSRRELIEGDRDRAEDARIIQYRGMPVKNVKTAWRKLRERCGLDPAVTTYSFRHTMARHMRAEGVPAWEVAAQLGHKTAGVTDRYAPFSPEYLTNAVGAIDAFLADLR